MSMKHFRYRKVTPIILAEMKALHEKGWSYRKIARKFNISLGTVLYHLTAYYKPQALIRAERSNQKQQESEYYQRLEVRARRKKWIREYIRERYQNDPEFRRKMIRANSGGKFSE